MKIYLRTPVKGNVQDVFLKFNKDLFVALNPPMVKVEMKRFDGCRKGDEYHFIVKTLPRSVEWKGQITDDYQSENKCFFTDEGVELPYPLTKWKHIHKVEKYNDEVMIIDDIEFEVSSKILAPFVYSVLLATFTYRIPIYKRIFS